MILAGDIGGTRSRLALFEAGQPEPYAERTLPSREYDDFATLLQAFLDEVGAGPGNGPGNGPDNGRGRVAITEAAFGVAGPVRVEAGDARVQATNLPWTLSAASLSEILGGASVQLVNDLIAVGLGAMDCRMDQRVDLNPDGIQTPGHVAVIAPGTGLGEAVFFHDGERHHPMPSEGGHCDFAPNDEQEAELLAFLWHRFGGHVSYERILSGDGFSLLYAFARHNQLGRAAPKADRRLGEASDPNALITQWAARGEDDCAVLACRLFARILGAEAGNLALKVLPMGGVYIAGAVAGYILPFLREHTLEGFINKGRFATMLGRIPLWVVPDGDLGLAGARRLAEQQRISNEDVSDG
ncbi:MAG TPA: glucokinase [Guyparkeria sp.]|nr:glucokinase [Guyparkeria sp.]